MPIARFKGCAPYDPEFGNQYGYKPSTAAAGIFTALFAISTILHIVQASWRRMWWNYMFAVGALAETMGWAGRAWSSQCPSNLNAFLLQIVTLIFAPAFFMAGVYIILGRLIALTGGKGKSSIISPTWYLWIFCSCDMISLVIQAVGGSKASKAAAADPPTQSKTGTNIMVSGIVFQMASMTLFVGFVLDFLRRTRKMNATLGKRVNILIAATAFSVLLIFIRSIYRTVELLQGWDGYLLTHESYFIGLDGTTMFLAVAIFNVVHPAWFLPRAIGHVGLSKNDIESEAEK
ncbi:RTA1-domain-containing protein [Tothia fuscella]|uniref:RTA1-domain-containing protein n=1 Tax=Tothia fuscella TaxID=1048955 RepID=A0A9P4TY87_9PEZI|nr:RTA1-domain-containing protein [Tothia fuscella]